MKKLHLFKRTLLLLALIVGCVSYGWATDPSWTHSFASPEAISNNSITVNGATWTVATTSGEGSPTISTGSYSSTYGLKFGSSKSVYFGSVTFSTNYFNNYNVKSVTVNILNNGKKTGTLTAQQGNTSIGSTSQEFGQAWTTLTVNTNSGSGGALSFTYSVDQAFYIHSITVVYDNAPSYTINAQSNNNTYGTVSLTGTTITATPASGYRVKNGDTGYTVTDGTASVAHEGYSNTLTVTPTSNCTVQVNFEEIPTRTLTMASNDDSYGSATALATSILEEATTTITATPNDGYRFVEWSVEGEGSSVETATDESTTFTMGSENAKVTANFEAIPVWTLSSAVTPAAAGIITLGATSVREGANTTIEATPNAGFIFKNWSVAGTGASITDVNSASTTFTMGTADATVTAEFAATYTINWSVNGEIVQTETLETGTSLSDLFPDVSNIGTKTFVGWVTSSTVDADFEGEEFVKIATATAAANTTYYAVFATADGSEPILTKLGSDATFSEGDNIVIVAKCDEDHVLGLYQENADADNYVKNFAFDGQASTINTDSKKYWTLTAKDDKWYLGDKTNKYLYTSGSNNLQVSDYKTEWTISWSSTAFRIYGNGRYLSCRSDLTSANKYLYRMGGTDGSSGMTYFDIYKFVSESVTYSAYTTSVTEVYTVSTNTGRNYGSYVTAKKLDFASAEGITAYIAKGFNNSKNAIVLQEVGVVPAGTAIIVKTDEKGGSADVEVTNDEASDVSENALVAGDGTTAWNGTDGYTYYYLASDLFHKATSGTLQSGKAYLKVANGDVPAGAHSFGFIFDDEEATGINTVAKDAESGQFFNLAGQRVAQPTKGLYIVNGRKVIVK